MHEINLKIIKIKKKKYLIQIIKDNIVVMKNKLYLIGCVASTECLKKSEGGAVPYIRHGINVMTINKKTER